MLFAYEGYSSVTAQSEPGFNKQLNFRRKRGAGRAAERLWHKLKHGVIRAGNTAWQWGVERKEHMQETISKNGH